MLFPLAVYKQPLVKNADFYWPLALAALKNASANSSRTATIELLCTTEDSITLDKEDSINYTSTMTSLPSTLCRALEKVFVEFHLVLDKEKSS